jgi:hypothetical protein
VLLYSDREKQLNIVIMWKKIISFLNNPQAYIAAKQEISWVELGQPAIVAYRDPNTAKITGAWRKQQAH